MTIFCPAKLNLFLAVTGRQNNGFHDLVSLVSKVSWGDDLVVETLPTEGCRTIECNDPEVPLDASNLVWRAADAFAVRAGVRTGFRFRLTKRIPCGSGLGGGSSDAVGALKAMNLISGSPLDREALGGLAVECGSDCPLFLHDGPVVMRGRGERLDSVSLKVGNAITGLRLALFKPSFGINTAWAYRKLAEKAPSAYLEPNEAESRLASILSFPERPSEYGFNSFLDVVGKKYPAIPVLLDLLRQDHEGASFMSGSGSACAIFVRTDSELDQVRNTIHQTWGEGSFLADVQLI
jgi:4-diphosphocytidyl-2-C-methyl-D-erythritol kinase